MILDNLIAIRILYLLVTPFEKQEAYRVGAIDSNGNAKLKISEMTPEQRTNYTMLHRLVFRLKKMLGALPFGKTTLASFGAAYLLVRECIDQKLEPSNLEEMYDKILTENKVLFENSFEGSVSLEDLEKSFSVINSVLENMKELSTEDGAITTTSGLQTSTPTIKTKQTKMINMLKVPKTKFEKIRSGKKVQELYNNQITIIVNEETEECFILGEA